MAGAPSDAQVGEVLGERLRLRPRSATDTAPTASVPRSRAGSARRPRPPRRVEAGVLAQVARNEERPCRSSSTSTAPELMNRPNCRAAAFVVGRLWILAARSSQVSAGKIARQPSSQRASVAPCASRARNRTGTATRPRSSSACRNSPVRNEARSIVSAVHHYSPYGPIWNHRAPLYRAALPVKGFCTRGGRARTGTFGSGPMAAGWPCGARRTSGGVPGARETGGGCRPGRSGRGRRLGHPVELGLRPGRRSAGRRQRSGTRPGCGSRPNRDSGTPSPPGHRSGVIQYV